MNRYEAGALYDLTTTCIKPLTTRELLNFTSYGDTIYDTPLSYGDITGSIRLKKAIQSLYEYQDLNNITVTHGAIGANQLVFLSPNMTRTGSAWMGLEGSAKAPPAGRWERSSLSGSWECCLSQKQG